MLGDLRSPSLEPAVLVRGAEPPGAPHASGTGLLFGIGLIPVAVPNGGG